MLATEGWMGRSALALLVIGLRTDTAPELPFWDVPDDLATVGRITGGRAWR